MLRLELIVLVDSCRSPEWRSMLWADQRNGLCALLTDLLAALYVDAEEMRTGISDAQDRVLVELLPRSAVESFLADPASARELGCEHDPTVAELISLIEARAIARAGEKAAAIVHFR